MPNIDKFEKDGFTYYRLFIMCPVCKQQGRNTPPQLWVHSKDEGDIYIGDNAHYLCKKCGYEEHIMKWGYYCPNHSNNKDDYQLVQDETVIADVVTAAGEMVNSAGVAWLTTLLQHL